MPGHSRLWVFASPRPLQDDEARDLLSRVDSFLEEWHAHGHPVSGSRDWLDDQFLLIAADEEATGVSGCSIDSLFRVFKAMERETGVSMMDASRVWYRDAEGRVRSLPRAEFRDLARDGEVGPETLVFDNTVATVRGLRDGKWERPLRDSWHAKAFP